MSALPTRLVVVILYMCVLPLSTACGGEDDGTSAGSASASSTGAGTASATNGTTDSASTGTSSTTSDGTTDDASAGTSGTTFPDTTSGEYAPCDDNCARIDECDAYEPVAFDDVASCVDACEANGAVFANAGCPDEYAAMLDCVTEATCEDVEAYLGDPSDSGVCSAEVTALMACAS